MQGDIIAALRAERADLERKISALDGLLALYGDVPSGAKSSTNRPAPSKPSAPSGRMTEYGRQVREKAIEMMKIVPDPTEPTPTVALLAMLEHEGVSIRGGSPRNALSAILSRDPRFRNHDRKGWTLSNEALLEHFGFYNPEENEPPSDKVAGGSDTEQSADRKSALFS